MRNFLQALCENPGQFEELPAENDPNDSETPQNLCDELEIALMDLLDFEDLLRVTSRRKRTADRTMQRRYIMPGEEFEC